MKHYLDLVPISAKIHKKQSRMSIFCIVLAVFLVTTIFGMADMFIRSQILQAQQESGNWHIAIKNISNPYHLFHIVGHMATAKYYQIVYTPYPSSANSALHSAITMEYRFALFAVFLSVLHHFL